MRADRVNDNERRGTPDSFGCMRRAQLDKRHRWAWETPDGEILLLYPHSILVREKRHHPRRGEYYEYREERTR